jgi:hypothetical protein
MSNQITRIGKALLNGEVLSILTGFQRFCVTNLPREIGRSIERKFGIKCERKQIDIETQDGETGYYFEYRLLYTEENKEGIQRMKDYIKQIEGEDFNPKVHRGRKIIHQKAEPKTKATPTPMFKQESLFANL